MSVYCRRKAIRGDPPTIAHHDARVHESTPRTTAEKTCEARDGETAGRSRRLPATANDSRRQKSWIESWTGKAETTPSQPESADPNPGPSWSSNAEPSSTRRAGSAAGRGHCGTRSHDAASRTGAAAAHARGTARTSTTRSGFCDSSRRADAIADLDRQSAGWPRRRGRAGQHRTGTQLHADTKIWSNNRVTCPVTPTRENRGVQRTRRPATTSRRGTGQNCPGDWSRGKSWGRGDPMVNDPDDLYAELGVSENATPKEIAEAWRLRVSIWHPDKHSGAPQKVQDLAKATTARLNRARDILSDSEQRRRYDAGRKQQQTRRGENADQWERTREEPTRPHWQKRSDGTHQGERRKTAGTRGREHQERDAPGARKRASQARGADGRWKQSEVPRGGSQKPSPGEGGATTTPPNSEIFGTVVVYCFGLGAAAGGLWLIIQIPAAMEAAFTAIPKAWLVGIIALGLLSLWSPRLVIG